MKFSRVELKHISTKQRDMIIACGALLMVGIQLAVARLGAHQSGFPLDDAWIYQVYGRNLAETGQWAFVPGTPSTGSTSILWTLLIAPAYWLRLDGETVTLALGAASLVLTSLGAVRLVEDSALELQLGAGLAVATQWQLIWASVSGMETILFCALVVWFWVWVNRRANESSSWLFHALIPGMWGGVLMLGRPEGVLAFAIALPVIVFRSSSLGDRIRNLVLACVGFAIILAPFIALNLAVSGSVWPNTFYAKQTEYAVLWTQPYMLRLAQQIVISLVGPQIVILPGLLGWIWSALRSRPVAWRRMLPLIWVLAHWAIYAFRLPVIYQHGRYAIPVVAVLITYSVTGMALLARANAQKAIIRLGSRVWLAAAILVFPLFSWVIGVPAYVRDLEFINSEMVAAARWIDNNTLSSDTIAAHDIGALGYFAPRPLVDLAGLVSPDVIPIMNNGSQLSDYVVENRAKYLVVFPRWSPGYSQMVSDPRFCKEWSSDLEHQYQEMSELGPLTIYRVEANANCSSP